MNQVNLVDLPAVFKYTLLRYTPQVLYTSIEEYFRVPGNEKYLNNPSTRRILNTDGNEVHFYDTTCRQLLFVCEIVS